MAKVRMPDGPFGCWIWTAGRRGRQGYGSFSIAGRDEYAHRVAWVLLVGPVPEGMKVCHNCPGGDNPACVNPAHLWLGTQADNMRDCVAKGRHNKPRGEDHPKAILSADAVCNIRTLRSTTTLSAREIGNRYGVDKTTVQRVLSGKNWHHVIDPPSGVDGS